MAVRIPIRSVPGAYLDAYPGEIRITDRLGSAAQIRATDIPKLTKFLNDLYKRKMKATIFEGAICEAEQGASICTLARYHQGRHECWDQGAFVASWSNPAGELMKRIAKGSKNGS